MQQQEIEVEGGCGLLRDDPLGIGSVAANMEVELGGIPALRGGEGSSEGGRGRRAVLELKGFDFGVDIVDGEVLSFGFGL